MAYSRWTNSRWYTYWSAKSGETIEEQMFQICSDWSDDSEDLLFNYNDIKKDPCKCLEKVKRRFTDATEEELRELKSYMDKFMMDMEVRYL